MPADIVEMRNEVTGESRLMDAARITEDEWYRDNPDQWRFVDHAQCKRCGVVLKTRADRHRPTANAWHVYCESCCNQGV